MNKPIVLVTGIGPSPTSIRPSKAKAHLIRVAVEVFISVGQVIKFIHYRTFSALIKSEINLMVFMRNLGGRWDGYRMAIRCLLLFFSAERHLIVRIELQ